MSVLPTVAKVVGIVALSDGVWWLLKKPVLSIWFGVLSYKEETFVTSEKASLDLTVLVGGSSSSGPRQEATTSKIAAAWFG